MARTNKKLRSTKMTKKVQIVGDAMVITSKLKLETIKKIQKFNKDLLCLTEIRDNTTNELFRIETGKVASFNKYGITFTNANAEGYACATLLLPNNVKDRKEYVKDEYGTALVMLADLEDAIATAAAEIDSVYAKLEDEITEI